MEYKFTSEITHDLTLQKEFSHTYRCSSTHSNIILFLIALAHLWYITLFSNMQIIAIFLLYFAIFWIQIYRNTKQGDVNYRRNLIANGGKPPHIVYQFAEDSILSVNLDNDGRVLYSYDQIKAMIESKNLLILEMPERLCMILQKDQLTGGTPQELKAFLFEKCTAMRRKKLKGLTLGKWIYRFYIGTMLLAMLTLLFNFPGFSIWDRVTGRLHNGLSYLEMAQELKPLDISIGADTIDDMELYDRDYMKEFGTDYYSDNPDASKVQDLLYWEAAGIWDPDTGEWTPSRSGLFWYDTVAATEETMYEDLFTGLQAMESTLVFTNVQADFSKADQQAGTGTVTVSFDYRNGHYSFDLQYDNEWLDLTILFGLMDIFHQDELAEDLYYAYDGQGVYLYYNTKSQVSALERKTGLDFYNTASGFGFWP